MKFLKEGFDAEDIRFTKHRLNNTIEDIVDAIDNLYYSDGFHITEAQARTIFDIAIKRLIAKSETEDGGLFDAGADGYQTLTDQILKSL